MAVAEIRLVGVKHLLNMRFGDNVQVTHSIGVISLRR